MQFPDTASSPVVDTLCASPPELAGDASPPDPDSGDTPLTPDGALPRSPRGGTASFDPPAAWTAELERKVKVIANRTRSECISFRLTTEERTLFDARRKLSGLKMHEFLVELLNKKKIIVKPGGDIVIVQLKRIGNNLNQIAHHVNAGRITDCRSELRVIRDELEKIRTAWQ